MHDVDDNRCGLVLQHQPPAKIRDGIVTAMDLALDLFVAQRRAHLRAGEVSSNALADRRGHAPRRPRRPG